MVKASGHQQGLCAILDPHKQTDPSVGQRTNDSEPVGNVPLPGSAMGSVTLPVHLHTHTHGQPAAQACAQPCKPPNGPGIPTRHRVHSVPKVQTQWKFYLCSKPYHKSLLNTPELFLSLGFSFCWVELIMTTGNAAEPVRRGRRLSNEE